MPGRPTGAAGLEEERVGVGSDVDDDVVGADGVVISTTRKRKTGSGENMTQQQLEKVKKCNKFLTL
jgi:phage tail sheath protein FI